MVLVELDGERVRTMREGVAPTKAEFARRVGIAPATLRQAERGEAVSARTGRKIAAALGVEPPQRLGLAVRR